MKWHRIQMKGATFDAHTTSTITTDEIREMSSMDDVPDFDIDAMVEEDIAERRKPSTPISSPLKPKIVQSPSKANKASPMKAKKASPMKSPVKKIAEQSKQKPELAPLNDTESEDERQPTYKEDDQEEEFDDDPDPASGEDEIDGSDKDDSTSDASHEQEDREGLLHAKMSEEDFEKASNKLKGKKTGKLRNVKKFIDDIAAESENENMSPEEIEAARKEAEYQRNLQAEGVDQDEYEREGMVPEGYVSYEHSPKKTKKKRLSKLSKKRKRINDSDEEEEEEESDANSEPPARKKSKRPVSEQSSEAEASSEDDDDDDDSEKKSPQVEKKKSKMKSSIEVDGAAIDAMLKTGDLKKERPTAGYADLEDVKGRSNTTTSEKQGKGKQKAADPLKLKSPKKSSTRKSTPKAKASGPTVGCLVQLTTSGPVYRLTYFAPDRAPDHIPEGKSRREPNWPVITVHHLSVAQLLDEKGNPYNNRPQESLCFLMYKESSIAKPVLITDKKFKEIWENSKRVLRQKDYAQYTQNALDHANLRTWNGDDGALNQRLYFPSGLYEEIRRNPSQKGVNDSNANVRVTATSAPKVVSESNARITADSSLEPPARPKPQQATASSSAKKQKLPKIDRKLEKESHDITKLLSQNKVVKATVVHEKKTTPPLGDISPDSASATISHMRGLNPQIRSMLIAVLSKWVFNGNGPQTPAPTKEYLETRFKKFSDSIASCMEEETHAQFRKLVQLNQNLSTGTMIVMLLPYLLPEALDIIATKCGVSVEPIAEMRDEDQIEL